VDSALANALDLRALAPAEEASPTLREGMPGEAAAIARAVADPAAFAPVYEFYVDAVFRYCRRRVTDTETAADLTSQIFIKVITALPAYTARPNRSSFRSWLFTITRNHVIDAARTRRPASPLATDVVTSGRSVEEHGIDADIRQRLDSALASLTEAQRQVVELRLAGLTIPEIAQVLGMREAAAKSLQFRAFTRLRQLLADIAPEGGAR
jgi:RNA polymerase sigma-70 factor (ECF subfamily)